VRHALLLALAGCGAAKTPVVTWISSSGPVVERIELQSNGNGKYLNAINGVAHPTQEVILSRDQIDELADIMRAKNVCKFSHDPAYTPQPDEGQTSLEIAFPDQHCKVMLWNREWLQGPALDISETMRSMRPVQPPAPRK
jgi:hypothetical protein